MVKGSARHNGSGVTLEHEEPLVDARGQWVRYIYVACAHWSRSTVPAAWIVVCLQIWVSMGSGMRNVQGVVEGKQTYSV